MKHCGIKTIETDRLILRRFKNEDSKNMFKNWASDPEVTKYLTWPAHSDIGITEFILSDWINSYEKEDFYNWAIELKEIGEVIGNISSVGNNDTIMKVHIGYCIGKEWWNKGIMSEALKAVIDYFFTEVEVNRVESRHDVNNPGSGKVMQKCGMIYEGTLRQADKNNLGICDTAYYGILKSDWEKNKGERING